MEDLGVNGGHRCRLCKAPLSRTFVDLGVSPLANSYLEPADLERPETFYPLKAYVCEACFLVQLPQEAKPEEIFSHYAYFSSVSESWVEHARRYAEMAIDRFRLGPESLVLELASNDGYLLRNFQERGVPVLGVEPAANVARVAQEAGITTEVGFFTEEKAHALAAEGVRADLLVANNVLAHVPDLHDFVAGIETVLADDGVATLEFPHLMHLIDDLQFDTIYHEHYSYFSLHCAVVLFASHDLEIFDVEEIPTHGGSLRVYVRHARSEGPSPSERLRELMAREHSAGLRDSATYSEFEERVRAVKREALHFLLDVRDRHQSVAGYGAPAKGNTLLNYCGVGPDLLPYTVDRSPHKQGRYLPGTRIPIAGPDRLREEKPDYVLVLPWNLRDEIVEQMADVRAWGGRFVVAIPEVEVF